MELRFPATRGYLQPPRWPLSVPNLPLLGTPEWGAKIFIRVTQSQETHREENPEKTHPEKTVLP